MNNSIIKTAFVGIFSMAFLAACGGGGTNFDDPVKDETYSSGDVDLSRYVALGDSLTAGFKDGTLYLDGQLDSFPNILSQLFAEADGGTFVQPLVGDNLGGLLAGGVDIASPNEQLTRLVLGDVGGGELGIKRQDGTRTMDLVLTPLTGGPYNNMGVPGAKSFHLLASGYGNFANLPANANPWAVYLNIADGTNTIVGESLTLAPTFFTLWIGNNDILGYGTTGGDGSNPITPASDGDSDCMTIDFEDCYATLTTLLTSGGAKGVLINIPAIVDIPFFTAVPYNAIPLTQAQADAANAAYSTYNTALAGAVAGSLITQAEADQRTINFVAGQNAVVILDEDLTDLTGLNPLLLNFRQATANDYILLTTGAILGEERVSGNPATLIGIGSALTDSEALTEAEAAEIETAREAYNTVISGLAASNPDLVLYDAAADLAEVSDSDGLNFGTGTVNATLPDGGAFSLDGVHPTAKGYAIIANGVIDAMNTGFTGTDLPRTDPGTYTEVFFEFPDGFDFSP